ncbi:MAG: hypothetical protein NBV68_11990 [Erythrobacter sp.]|uniref:hypothetical protein n=1 Tax=Erythrobacter sp. TaxID=1042 RepID=UPI0025EA2488|nr:hypothetical protein [Erythrobacter sp.]MCM0000096.1 hypothetical protein [Erythrobacter sp.]
MAVIAHVNVARQLLQTSTGLVRPRFNSRTHSNDIGERLPLADIQRVTFYKRDELTTDLICCDIEARGRTWFYHEEAEGWDHLLHHLAQLPNFRRDWYEAVVHPPFAACETVAFSRS